MIFSFVNKQTLTQRFCDETTYYFCRFNTAMILFKCNETLDARFNMKHTDLPFHHTARIDFTQFFEMM